MIYKYTTIYNESLESFGGKKKKIQHICAVITLKATMTSIWAKCTLKSYNEEKKLNDGHEHSILNKIINKVKS